MKSTLPTTVVDHVLLRELASTRTAPCVSVYLPSDPVAPSGEAARIELDHRVAEARAVLRGDHGMRERAVEEFLDPITSLPRGRWPVAGRGLALFRAPGVWHEIVLADEVPAVTKVGDRFALLPLVPHLTDGSYAYVLTLSAKAVRLFRVDELGLQEVHVEALPRGVPAMARAGYAQHHDRPITRHGGDHIGRNGITGTLHGPAASDERRRELQRFLEQLDAALKPVLAGETAPLVLATVEQEAGLFRQMTSYRHLAEGIVVGNPDRLRPDELHRRAWTIVTRERSAEDLVVVARSQALLASGRAVAVPEAVLTAATEGRVRLLLVAADTPAEDDTVDWAVAETLRHGGEVRSAPAGALTGTVVAELRS